MKVLITAGQVYGRLDDNKLVGNRIRGIWAMKFAGYLADAGHNVTLLVPDTITRAIIQQHIPPQERSGTVTVTKQTGFKDYHLKCVAMAATHDAAIMAAAVVNWIPANPISGKMDTKGYATGDIINIPFVLAPRVIEDMKAGNSKLTLIGCKMLIGSTEEELLAAAYGVLLKSRCNVVIANDMKLGLKRKLLVYKDRSVHEYDNDFDGFFAALQAVIEDEHFRTVFYDGDQGLFPADLWNAKPTFDLLVKQHRGRFLPVEGGRVFGSLCVTCYIHGGAMTGWLVSPREKGGLFTADDATLVRRVDLIKHEVEVPTGWNKPTLNAPLLIRFCSQFHHLQALHFHEQVPGLPTLPYAPPGTVRDNQRELPANVKDGFNIEGHGCVIPARSTT